MADEGCAVDSGVQSRVKGVGLGGETDSDGAGAGFGGRLFGSSFFRSGSFFSSLFFLSGSSFFGRSLLSGGSFLSRSFLGGGSFFRGGLFGGSLGGRRSFRCLGGGGSAAGRQGKHHGESEDQCKDLLHFAGFLSVYIFKRRTGIRQPVEYGV